MKPIRLTISLLLLVLTIGAQERQRWASPTYTIEIRAIEASADSANRFSITLDDGWMKLPNGKVVKLEKHAYPLPFVLHADANRQIRLKIKPNAQLYGITVFYEYGDIVQKRGGTENRAGEGIVLNIEPYAEDK